MGDARMQKIFGILLIVLAIWVAIEVFTKGMDGAFGGLLADHSSPRANVQAEGGLPSRARDRVTRALQTHEERTLRQTDPDGRPGE
ncbi:MAG TPA: hypothetical protein DEP35_14590 [Deltaproteobacteria bacterium]|nr:hypothetical protein [Deltaproteobacteria bacterium]